MPQQQQMSSFAKKLGPKVAEANEQHASAPIDLGNRRLPAGIREGIAKLSSMYTKDYEDGEWKGQTFFRASAVVVFPKEHKGEKVAGLVTSVMVPLCDQPAKEGSQRKARTFSDNWFDFQNVFKLLGIYPPDGEGGRPDYTARAMPDRAAAGLLIEQYYFAAMRMLTDPARMKSNPVYIVFSTRGWTPPVTPTKPNPEEMVFETWHGLATAEQVREAFGGGDRPDPARGVVAAPQPPPGTPPPNGQSAPPQMRAPDHQPTQSPSAPYEASESESVDLSELVAALVEVAMNDPDGATDEGAEASGQLERLAWDAGWTEEQTRGAADWAAVGEMALNPPAPPTAPTNGAVATSAPEPSGNGVAVGSRWMFAKRTKDGAKLKNSKGEEFPAQEYEVVAVDHAAQTCTLKSAKDGKDCIDIRSKKPITVKFEWLEKVPY